MAQMNLSTKQTHENGFVVTKERGGRMDEGRREVDREDKDREPLKFTCVPGSGGL